MSTYDADYAEKFYDAYGMLEWDRLEATPYGCMQAIFTPNSSSALYAEAIEFSMQVVARVGSPQRPLNLAQRLRPLTYRSVSLTLRGRKSERRICWNKSMPLCRPIFPTCLCFPIATTIS